MAMIAKQLGRSVLLLESDRHPRFAIGESSVPLGNLLWEELVTRYKLPRLAPLAKWGTWQASYPEISCGLKRGFSFLHHQFGEPWVARRDRSNELLVGASPHNRIADTHWYRAETDEWLVNEAQSAGVKYVDQVRIESAGEADGGTRLAGVHSGEPVTVEAEFVVDATGPRGCLHGCLGLEERELPGYPKTEALYTHFEGVKNFRAPRESAGAPYPIDAAALHHVFEGGWLWVLHFNNGVTSAGVAARSEIAEEFGFSEGAPAWERLMRRLPSVGEQFAGARSLRPFIHSARPSFRSAEMAGKRWAMLPSAAGFVDPLLSTGFPLTLLGVSRLARLLEEDWGTERFAPGLTDYAKQTNAELLAAARLIAGLYGSMGNFEEFARLSLLYFAAASYGETARRLGKPHLAPSFLLHDHPQFGPAMERALANPTAESTMRAIEPIDVAGLSDSTRNNWYGANAADLLRSAHKVGAGKSEINALLQRCGFWN